MPGTYQAFETKTFSWFLGPIVSFENISVADADPNIFFLMAEFLAKGRRDILGFFVRDPPPPPCWDLGPLTKILNLCLDLDSGGGIL